MWLRNNYQNIVYTRTIAFTEMVCRLIGSHNIEGICYIPVLPHSTNGVNKIVFVVIAGIKEIEEWRMCNLIMLIYENENA